MSVILLSCQVSKFIDRCVRICFDKSLSLIHKILRQKATNEARREIDICHKLVKKRIVCRRGFEISSLLLRLTETTTVVTSHTVRLCDQICRKTVRISSARIFLHTGCHNTQRNGIVELHSNKFGLRQVKEELFLNLVSVEVFVGDSYALHYFVSFRLQARHPPCPHGFNGFLNQSQTKPVGLRCRVEAYRQNRLSVQILGSEDRLNDHAMRPSKLITEGHLVQINIRIEIVQGDWTVVQCILRNLITGLSNLFGSRSEQATRQRVLENDGFIHENYRLAFIRGFGIFTHGFAILLLRRGCNKICLLRCLTEFRKIHLGQSISSRQGLVLGHPDAV
nr:MAG TPA: hypothetical protein [Caudoviricetes sp.]